MCIESRSCSLPYTYLAIFLFCGRIGQLYCMKQQNRMVKENNRGRLLFMLFVFFHLSNWIRELTRAQHAFKPSHTFEWIAFRRVCAHGLHKVIHWLVYLMLSSYSLLSPFSNSNYRNFQRSFFRSVDCAASKLPFDIFFHFIPHWIFKFQKGRWPSKLKRPSFHLLAALLQIITKTTLITNVGAR